MPGSGQSAAANSGSGESADAISGQSADAISGELADVISGPAADAISGESADSGFGQSANVTSAGYEKPSLEDIFKNSRIYLPNENEMARNAKTTTEEVKTVSTSGDFHLWQMNRLRRK